MKERITIQNEFNSRISFKAIAEQLGKDSPSISRELRRHSEQKGSGGYGMAATG
jgi:IS30 family transposase